jgi:leucyl aminopeptidase (aminopeptidase T)
MVDDGTVSDGEPGEGRRPRPTQVRLPAGEVMAAPAGGVAQGRVVVDSMTYRGREVTGLTAVFKNGRVVNLYARSGGEAVRSLYDASGPGKELLAYVDVGVNPEVRDPAGTKLNAPMPKGMVTIWLGNNTRVGGDNATPFELPLYLPGSTLVVEGKPLVQSGRLVLPTSTLPADESDAAPTAEPATGASADKPRFFGPEPLTPPAAPRSGSAFPRSRPAGAP